MKKKAEENLYYGFLSMFLRTLASINILTFGFLFHLYTRTPNDGGMKFLLIACVFTVWALFDVGKYFNDKLK